MCKYKHEVWTYQVGSCMYVALLFGRIFSAHRTPNSLLLFEAILELLSWWPKGMLSVLWTSAFPHNWSKSLWILKQHITPEFSVFVRKVWAVCAALRVLWQSPGGKQHSLGMPREQRTEYIVQLLWTDSAKASTGAHRRQEKEGQEPCLDTSSSLQISGLIQCTSQGRAELLCWITESQIMLGWKGPSGASRPTPVPIQDTPRTPACVWEHFPNISTFQRTRWSSLWSTMSKLLL